MKRILLFGLVLSIIALSIGCASAATPPAVDETLPMLAATSAPAATQAPAAAQAYDSAGKAVPSLATGGSGSVANGLAQADTPRMVVYTGSMSLQVNDTADTINKITDLLKSVNGYISSKSLVAFGKDQLRGTIVVRIPAAALDTTLAQIKAFGVKVLKEDASSNDVTEEYVDLDARRKNLESYETELQQLLDTVRERTGKAEDILAVYNQLTEVRGEIDQIVGRQKYLENTSTLATYTIEFVPVEEPVVVQGKPGWDPGRTVGEALDRLVGTLQNLGDIAIVLAIDVIPVLAIVLLPLALLVVIVRAFARRRGTKKPVTAS